MALKSSENDKRVGWFCAYTPVELIEAAGLRPVRLFGDGADSDEANALLHPATCPYLRACLAAAQRESGPHMLVFANSCDGMRRLHDAWKHFLKPDFCFLLDLPRRVDWAGVGLYHRDLLRLREDLESLTGRAITPGALRRAVSDWEATRRELRDSADGLEGIERVRRSVALQEEGLAWKPGDARGAAPQSGRQGRTSGVPVVVTGNIVRADGLLSLMEEAGCRLVAADICSGDRFFQDLGLNEAELEGLGVDGMLRRLAERYLARIPCPRMVDSRRRHEHLLETVRRTGARGVIYVSIKFCDAFIYDFPRLRAALDAASIPVLMLESDYSDQHEGQLLTRIEAFLEIIGDSMAAGRGQV